MKGITCFLPFRAGQFFGRLRTFSATCAIERPITRGLFTLRPHSLAHPLVHDEMNRTIEELRSSSHMRFESPEPESRQGRRNVRTAGVQLLDADGAISIEVRLWNVWPRSRELIERL